MQAQDCTGKWQASKDQAIYHLPTPALAILSHARTHLIAEAGDRITDGRSAIIAAGDWGIQHQWLPLILLLQLLQTVGSFVKVCERIFKCAR